MTKIMLAEDDNGLREIYSVRLAAEGYNIVTASDGEEALAVALRERPDLIVSDVMMPKISGFEMLDNLRATPGMQNVKVIMMTALSSDEERQRGEHLGANRYLVKSQAGIEDVVNAVHDILGDRAGGGMAQVQAAPAAQPAPVAAPVAQTPAAQPAPAPVTPVQAAQPAAAVQPAPAAQPAPTAAPVAQTPVAQPAAAVQPAQPAPVPVAQPAQPMQPTSTAPVAQPTAAVQVAPAAQTMPAAPTVQMPVAQPSQPVQPAQPLQQPQPTPPAQL